MTVVLVALGAFGSLIGSFLNVVVYRVPAGRSIVSPPSACGACGHEVRWFDNIPVVSWLILRGRCRDCSTRISIRYPLVELGAAAFFVTVALRFVPHVRVDDSPQVLASGIVVVIAYLYLAAISIALALIDLDTKRLPNVIVMPAYAVAVALLGSASILAGDLWPVARAGFGALILGGIYLLLAVIKPGAMGFGDVKLAGALGLFLGWLGWDVLAVGGLGGFILGGLFGVILLALGRAGRSTSVPFGPWMLAGAWLAIMAGHEIAAWYLSIFGLGEP